MKKIIAICLVALALLSFASCGDDKTDKKPEEQSVYTTEPPKYTMNANNMVITIDEGTLKQFLSAFPKESLGLKNDIYQYTFKFSDGELNGEKGCKAEAFPKDSKEPEGTFLVIDNRFYVYDNTKKAYLELTATGRVEPTAAVSTTKANVPDTTSKVIKDGVEIIVSNKSPENTEGLSKIQFYSKENDENLHKKLGGYTKEKLNLPKDIAEYALVVTGRNTKSKSDSTIYIIDVYEKDGTKTKFMFAFDDTDNYVYNEKSDSFEKIA